MFIPGSQLNTVSCVMKRDESDDDVWLMKSTNREVSAMLKMVRRPITIGRDDATRHENLETSCGRQLFQDAGDVDKTLRTVCFQTS